MKRLLLPLLLLTLCLSACDPNAGKRPNNYKNTRWTCEEPAIIFYVTENETIIADVRAPRAASGELRLHFDYGSGFCISSVPDGTELLTGRCSFSPEELRVRVERDDLFDGKYLGKELRFLRSDWDGVLPPGLTGSGTSAAETGAPATEKPASVPEQLPGEALCATWINAGQYSEGRDFVETLTIEPEGTIRVHLDYQGRPYSDLTGVWQMEGNTLTFTMSEGTVRVYDYELDGTVLSLRSEDRTVVYRRSD